MGARARAGTVIVSYAAVRFKEKRQTASRNITLILPA